MRPRTLFFGLVLVVCSAACSSVRYRQMRETAELTEIKDQSLGAAAGDEGASSEAPAGGAGATVSDRQKCLLDVRNVLAGHAKRLKLKAPYSKLGADRLMFALMFEQSYVQVDLHLPPAADGRLLVQLWVVPGASDERQMAVSDVFSEVEATVKQCS